MIEAPQLRTVRTIAENALGAGVAGIARVAEGVSTFVYRIQLETAAGSETLYLRILPEDASFAAEAHAHRLLASLGVRVPPVLHFEARNPLVERSVLIVGEIPGLSLQRRVTEHGMPDTLAAILHTAGSQIARLNRVPVAGFGWIDRRVQDDLRGESHSFRDFYHDALAEGGAHLPALGVTKEMCAAIHTQLDAQVAAMAGASARLVHGDFDVTHIFCAGPSDACVYTGLIDLGEMMGNHPLYDLALFRFYDELPPESDALAALLAGYSTIAPLSSADRRTVERLALLFGVWKIAKEMRKPQHNQAFLNLLAGKALVQLDRIQGTGATACT